jgi:hypothetical protein
MEQAIEMEELPNGKTKINVIGSDEPIAMGPSDGGSFAYAGPAMDHNVFKMLKDRNKPVCYMLECEGCNQPL